MKNSSYKSTRAGRKRKIVGIILIVVGVPSLYLVDLLGTLGIIIVPIVGLAIIVGGILLYSAHKAKMDELSVTNPDEYRKIMYEQAKDKSGFCNACYHTYSGKNEVPTNISWDTKDASTVTEYYQIAPSGHRSTTGVDRDYKYNTVMKVSYKSECGHCGEKFDCTADKSGISSSPELSFKQAKSNMQQYFNEKGWGNIDDKWNNVRY